MEDRIISRQFRSDDTSPWPYAFGNGSDGDLTVSSDTTFSLVNATCTGTIDTKTLSATNASFASGQLVIIIEMSGSNAGKWELNAIGSYVVGTITTVLSLQNTYANAQVIVMKQYRNVTVDATKTLTGPAYDGSKDGFLGFFCSGTLQVNGTISVTEKGYRGGTAGRSFGVNQKGSQGEGYLGVGSQSNSQNNSGGGAGSPRTTNEQGHGGGGAGYAIAGESGQDYGLTPNNHEVGLGGATLGVSDLTLLFMGPGGGGGGVGDAQGSAANGDGGRGGGILALFARFLNINSSTGYIKNDGKIGEPGDQDQGAGGSGVGGSSLVKTQIADISTDRLISQKTSTPGGTAGGAGRSYGGRINIDYLISLTGSTQSTLYGSFNTRQDLSLKNKRALISSFML